MDSVGSTHCTFLAQSWTEMRATSQMRVQHVQPSSSAMSAMHVCAHILSISQRAHLRVSATETRALSGCLAQITAEARTDNKPAVQRRCAAVMRCTLSGPAVRKSQVHLIRKAHCVQLVTHTRIQKAHMSYTYTRMCCERSYNEILLL